MLLVRALIAAVGVALGWSLQIAIYLSLTNPGYHDLVFWQTNTGVYATAGWLFVGLPVALSKPDKFLARPLRWILIVGAGGAALTLVPPAVALLPVVAPIAFLVAAFAMWAYISALHLWPRLTRD